ncbi:DNA-binding transcriptional MerR regulator [Catenuloplanes nepalensis]|uniref:DNA-binding transcriptional MerR regulator n=1 Tax=Catenuloplanes nepalensis TaxID=587533 RepID=A0ABT9MMW1_9ACTN|nr:helix-turn-helix domain-containing protein [Catenuloplanes nepalensis]MDP9792770.1 DNA-binding transcriptional MerR regulator [Catenuloplanes nepalensis]
MSPQADLRSSPAALDIAEVASRSGLSVSALRYYEEKGLIASAGRKGLRRQFTAGVLERLALVAIGRDAGFTLDEIAGMFGPDGEPVIDRALLATRADDLDRTIRRLTVLRDGLRHAAACPAPRHLDCPTFRRIMERAKARPASR